MQEVKNKTNPFSDYGGIVHGSRFIGRKKEINIIRERVLGEANGNLAVMGLPRIGKSSLVYESIYTLKPELIENGTIVVFFGVGKCISSKDFFSSIVSELYSEIDFYCEDPRKDRLEKLAKEIQLSSDISTYGSLVTKFFRFVKLLKYKIIYILDEFDSVQDFFEVSDFQLLRELSYNPETKICLITTSRKTLEEIEAKDKAISNFYGTFKDLRLGFYDDESLIEYWTKYSEYKTYPDSYKKMIDNYVSGHPFLMDLLNDYFFWKSPEEINNPKNIKDIEVVLLNQFETIEKTLQKEDLLNASIQLILGPVKDVTKVQEEKLIKYQFVKKVSYDEKISQTGRLSGCCDGKNSYVCFSKYFSIIFDNKHIFNIDYWPLWTTTETLLRKIIKHFIENKYPNKEDWESPFYNELMSRVPFNYKDHVSKQFNQLKQTREKSLSHHSYNGIVSENLIDYTLTRDIYNIFAYHYWKECFSDIFGNNSKLWIERLRFLADIRNPMAHNNASFVSKEDVEKASDYCSKIVETITYWAKKNQIDL